MSTRQHKIIMGVSMPRALKEKIDQKRGDIPRSKYISRILEQQIENKKDAEDQQSQSTPLIGHNSGDSLSPSPTTRCDGDAANDRE